jgi:hypothetical protein
MSNIKMKLHYNHALVERFIRLWSNNKNEFNTRYN